MKNLFLVAVALFLCHMAQASNTPINVDNPAGNPANVVNVASAVNFPNGVQSQGILVNTRVGANGAATISGATPTTTLTSTGSVNSESLTVQAGSGAYAAPIVFSTTGAVAGDNTFVNIAWASSTNPTLNFYNASTGGTLIKALMGTAQGGYSTLQFVYNGTSWSEFNKGEIPSRQVPPASLTALEVAPNTANGFFQLNGSGNFPSWTEDPSGTATFPSGSTLTMASGSTFNLLGTLVANLQQLYASTSSNAARTLATGQIAIDSDGLLAGGDFFWRYGVTGTPAGGQVLSVANLGTAPTITVPSTSGNFLPAVQNFGTSPISASGMTSYNEIEESPPAFYGSGSTTLTSETGTGPSDTIVSGAATFGSGPATTTLTTNANNDLLRSGAVNYGSGEVTAPSAWAPKVAAGAVTLDTGGVDINGTFSTSGTVSIGTTGASSVVIGATTAPVEIGNIYQIENQSTVTGASTMTVSSSYLANSSSSIAFTLPSTCTVGAMVQVIGMGSGGWTIAQGSGQQILYNGSATTSGTSGYLSGGQGTSVTLTCTTANTTFVPTAAAGTLTTH